MICEAPAYVDATGAIVDIFTAARRAPLERLKRVATMARLVFAHEVAASLVCPVPLDERAPLAMLLVASVETRQETN